MTGIPARPASHLRDQISKTISLSGATCSVLFSTDRAALGQKCQNSGLGIAVQPTSLGEKDAVQVSDSPNCKKRCLVRSKTPQDAPNAQGRVM